MQQHRESTRLVFCVLAVTYTLLIGRGQAFQLNPNGISSVNKNALLDLNQSYNHNTNAKIYQPTTLQMSSSADAISSFKPAKNWSALQSLTKETSVGNALQDDLDARLEGNGTPHVSNTLRLFDSSKEGNGNRPKLTFYRDQAGWCPYCEKTILLIEEKRIPIHIQTVPMRSYGDKPREFMAMVPNGLLPALAVEDEASGRKQVITESQVIMELLDQWHPEEEGYRPMLPSDNEGYTRYQQLARLERDLFGWWCTFLFRPESGSSSGGFGGVLSALTSGGGKKSEMSSSMRGFVDCLKRVDEQLRSTPGPWFFSSEEFNYPTMIDFIYISHIERMLASSAYWKGFKIRGSGEFPGIDAWLDAFDQRESYLAFKSDFYTNVMDIPPQYGPGYFGGVDEEVQEAYAKKIRGKDGSSWNLPLSHDEELEPLYQGPPLPVCALEAGGVRDYKNANQEDMARACRHAAAWKLASNGINVSTQDSNKCASVVLIDS